MITKLKNIHMSCNCKNPNSMNEMLSGDEINSLPVAQRITQTIFKVSAFLLLLLTLPLLNIYIIWTMFSVIVLNKSLDIMPLLKSIGTKFKEKEDDEDEEVFLAEEYNDLTEDDVVLLHTVDITNEEKIYN